MSGKENSVFSKLKDRVLDFIFQNQKIIGVSLILLIVVSLVILYFVSLKSNPKIEIRDSKETASVSAQITGEEILVDVSGAVQKPGVYQLPKDSRIKDALERAGGLSNEADNDFISQNINLAEKLTDGQKVFFSPVFEQESVAGTTSVPKNTSNSQTGKISLNHGSKVELDSLPGIGEKRSQAIIDNRPYSSVDELSGRKIIPASVYQKIKDLVVL